MPSVYGVSMATENPRVAELRSITDPAERAKACQTFIVNGRDTLRAVEQLRDDSIREARAQTPRPTIDELAKAAGVRRNVVVTALRGA